MSHTNLDTLTFCCLIHKWAFTLTVQFKDQSRDLLEALEEPAGALVCVLTDVSLFYVLLEKPGIYNIGGNAGLFSMRMVGIQKVTSEP